MTPLPSRSTARRGFSHASAHTAHGKARRKFSSRKPPGYARNGTGPRLVHAEAMPRVYALDTNAIIYYVTDESRACKRLVPIIQDPDVRLIVPAIVVMELWSAPHAPLEQMDVIRNFLATATIVPLDGPLAQAAGMLRRGNKFKTGDACIAATALSYGAILLTRNVRDFRRVRELALEAI